MKTTTGDYRVPAVLVNRDPCAPTRVRPQLTRMAWLFVAVACGTGFGLLYWAKRRSRAVRPIREAAPGSSVAELSAGRFRVVGRIVPIQTTASRIDESPCVFLERAIYRTVGSDLVPLLKQVSHVMRAHPFFLDDGTGRVMIDPESAVVDTITLVEDEGLLAERRLRAGEEVEVVARFAPREAESDGGPYRAGSLAWEAVVDDGLPPQIGYSSPHSSIVAADETTIFLRGLASVLFAAAALLGLAICAF
jgi:hypothetical protein